MMSNERRQAPTLVVVPRDNLEQTETKGYPLQKKKNKIMNTYLKRLTHTTDEQGRPCHSNSIYQILPQWMDEITK